VKDSGLGRELGPKALAGYQQFKSIYSQPEVLMYTAHAVKVDGLVQRYHVAGDLAGGRPVCLVHPGGPGIHWEYLRMPLVEERVTTVYVEPVGTGESGRVPGGDYGVARYADLVSGLIDQLGVGPVYFLGHSHGGFVGLQLAIDRPDQLAGLISYSSAPTFGADLGQESARGIDAFLRRWPDRPEAVAAGKALHQEEAFTDKESFLSWLAALLPAYFKDYWSMSEVLASWLPTIDATVDPDRKPDDWDIRGQLGSIRTRTLVMVGPYDFICGPRWATELSTAIPDAQLVTMAESGHFAHVEQPEEFAESVSEFMT